MKLDWQPLVQNQMEASLTMLEEVLQKCPDALWTTSLWQGPNMPVGLSDFWYLAYHTLFWLDLYLSGAVEGFQPPEPFDLAELDPAGLLPSRVFRRQELLGYLEHCRGKSRSIFTNLDDEKATRLCKFPWREIQYAELLLDNIRHIQEHGAQLRMVLGQQAGINSRWLA